VGIALKKNEDKSLLIRSTIWIVGITLLIHCISISSTSYFDQIIVYWYMIIAIPATFVQMYNITFLEKKQLKKRMKMKYATQVKPGY
jgi:hypothetical protein